MRIEVVGEDSGKEEHTKRRLQWLNREELTVAAELRQHIVFSVQRNSTNWQGYFCESNWGFFISAAECKQRICWVFVSCAQ